MSAGIILRFEGEPSGAINAANQTGDAIEAVQLKANAITQQASTQILGMSSSYAFMGVTAVMAYDMASAYGSRYAMMQERIQIAQENVTKALMNYGAGSIQVIQAQQQLKAVTEESKYAQGEYNREMLMMSAMIVPQMMIMFPKLVDAITDYREAAALATAQTSLLSASMLPLLGLGIGIVAMIGLMAFAGGTTGPSSSNVNVYGDVNMGGYANPYQFGTSVQSWTQAMRG